MIIVLSQFDLINALFEEMVKEEIGYLTETLDFDLHVGKLILPRRNTKGH